MILNTYIILLTKTYMCDIYINKKVLFNKKKYLNIFDAYMDYYKINIDLETKLYTKNIELKLIEQEYLSIMLIIRTNVVLGNTISDLINYGIPL